MRRFRCASTPAPQKSLSVRPSTNTKGPAAPPSSTALRVPAPPLQPIPLFPENLGVGGDQTAIVLCNPKNVHVGIWRNIRFESDRDISEGTLKIVATLRFDVKFAEEPGVAKAINVQL